VLSLFVTTNPVENEPASKTENKKKNKRTKKQQANIQNKEKKKRDWYGREERNNDNTL
jgi:hypothetical protein